jgi:hypothetical protein
MSYVSSTGFKALSKLQHLEQFIFGRDSEYSCGWTEESMHIVHCAKYLPQLKVIGRRLEFIGCDDYIDFPEGYHNDMLQHLQEPAVLGLQQLNLAGLAGDCLPNENVHFPQLEVLILWAPTNNMLNLCDRFESVSTLAIYHGRLFEDIMPVLCRVGQRLHSLVLFKVDKRVSLSEVLLNCPRLKCLVLEKSKFNQAPERWPAASFLCMEEVRFLSMKLPPGFIKQVNT